MKAVNVTGYTLFEQEPWVAVGARTLGRDDPTGADTEVMISQPGRGDG